MAKDALKKIVKAAASTKNCKPVFANHPYFMDQKTYTNAQLEKLIKVCKAIRKADCGAWLKDCQGSFTCADGREKRLELMRLLDKLYKVAGVSKT